MFVITTKVLCLLYLQFFFTFNDSAFVVLITYLIWVLIDMYLLYEYKCCVRTKNLPNV